ncbi:MAG: integrating conjugative element protein [Gammaproteobacteria bacterium]|nr:integrating conjugative element protein [Gammaproteobacteria bacterium]
MSIGMVLTPVSAWSEVTVIYDSGNTRPLAPYVEIIDRTEPANPRSVTGPKFGAADVQALLPVRSPGLSPGPVQAKSHDRPFSRPFFLIGSDVRSRQWLVEYRDRLQEIGAVGMLVQAETQEDLRAIARLALGLPILPASAADIGAALGISHYPVLITPQGIEQ